MKGVENGPNTLELRNKQIFLPTSDCPRKPESQPRICPTTKSAPEPCSALQLFLIRLYPRLMQ